MCFKIVQGWHPRTLISKTASQVVYILLTKYCDDKGWWRVRGAYQEILLYRHLYYEWKSFWKSFLSQEISWRRTNGNTANGIMPNALIRLSFTSLNFTNSFPSIFRLVANIYGRICDQPVSVVGSNHQGQESGMQHFCFFKFRMKSVVDAGSTFTGCCF